MIFEVPAVRAPSAMLRAIGRNGQEREIRIDGTLLTIGRAPTTAWRSTIPGSRATTPGCGPGTGCSS